MSYNVTGFTLKKLDSFTLPYAKLLEMSEGDVNIADDNVLTFDQFPVEGMEIVGSRNSPRGKRLNVADVSYHGEYSGTYWDEFEVLLEQSTGILKARVVWGGGDSVEVVTVENGIVTREEL